MTRRERLEAKVERRREWAAKRAAKSTASYESAREIGSHIPFGQPILVGHHSERHARRDAERIDSNMRKSVENSDMADYHKWGKVSWIGTPDKQIPECVKALLPIPTKENQ